MERYKIILAYDGTNYAGFQRQAQKNTVQAELEGALRKVGWTGSSILSTGRTDSGVHASGHVAAADLDWQHSLGDLLHALNSHLPQDIAVRSVTLERNDFHPRFNAVERFYQYRIVVDPVRDPLRERYAWRIVREPEPAVLAKSAALLRGTHDFKQFGRAQRAGGSTLRHVYTANWERTSDGWIFQVSGNGFLYHMVRRMVYVQIQAGWGLIALEEVQGAVDGKAALPPGIAPAQGLTLTGVRFAENRKEAQRLNRELM